MRYVTSKIISVGRLANAVHRRLWAAFLFAMCAALSIRISAMAKPTISFSSLDSEHVYLLPSTSAEFMQALSSNRSTAFDRILPYAALIKNDSGKTIIAYSVWWTYRADDGKTGDLDGIVIYDFDNFPPLTAIAPGGSRIASIMLRLGDARLIPTPRGLDLANNVINKYERQSGITISLDAVLFEDGTAAGPDTKQRISLWKAYVDSRRDLYTQIANMGGTGLTSILNQNIAIATPLVPAEPCGEPQT